MNENRLNKESIADMLRTENAGAATDPSSIRKASDGTARAAENLEEPDS